MSADLAQEWTFGEAIGGGGFARVVKAYDIRGEVHAAKFVTKEPGASRELLLAELDGVRNIVPVIDSGEIGDEYVLVMPLAESSLRDHLAKESPLPLAEALQILTDIATALADLDNKVIHRDLKPENILSLGGKWCLADFGISRYADAATEVGVTRKGMLSPQYAAPEQWMHKHATEATDVYAFGVIAFELLEGKRPFDGGSGQLRDDHLHSDPPEMSVGKVLQSLVYECLYKEPQARPSAANLVLKLGKARERAADSRWDKLSAANHAEVERRVAADTAEAREQTEYQRRTGLYDAAVASWTRISDQFQDRIGDDLSTAELTVRYDKHWNIKLNGATFGLSYPRLVSESNRDLPFDVIATSTLSVLVPGPVMAGTQWIGRSHSLYFADAVAEGQYGWFETSFMNLGVRRTLLEGNGIQEPYAINDLTSSDLHQALSNVIGLCQVAWQFSPVDSGDCDDLVARWLGWFADASQRQLSRPSTMPEHRVTRNWR